MGVVDRRGHHQSQDTTTSGAAAVTSCNL